MEFTKEHNEKFLQKDVAISFVPDGFEIKESRRKVAPIKFVSIQEYYNFLVEELEFWKSNTDGNFINGYIHKYETAITYLEKASNDSIGDFDRMLKDSVNRLVGIPNSKSILTREILKYMYESKIIL